jgi:hypothetical protein
LLRFIPFPLNSFSTQHPSFYTCLPLIHLKSCYLSNHQLAFKPRNYLKRGGGRGEKWPKPCMHIWIKEKKKRNYLKRLHDKGQEI